MVRKDKSYKCVFFPEIDSARQVLNLFLDQIGSDIVDDIWKDHI